MKKNKGFTLIEMIMAISVLSFGIVLVYSAFLTMVTLTSDISSRFTAAYLAQEGLEIVRNIRDNNVIAAKNNPAIAWSSGLLASPCNTGCQLDYKTENASELIPYQNTFLALNSQGFYSYDSSDKPTIFTRKITISPVQGNSDAMLVDVMVNWTNKGRTVHFEASEYLYNWQ